MWTYSGSTGAITPQVGNTSVPSNWTLDAVDAGIGKIKEFYWGGGATTSTAMHTRVSRASGEVGGQTTGNVSEYGGADQPANKVNFVTSYATTHPTLDAADIFSMSWNAHGGVVRWLADPDEEIWVQTGQTLDLITCKNTVGTATSSYGVIWSEFS